MKVIWYATNKSDSDVEITHTHGIARRLEKLEFTVIKDSLLKIDNAKSPSGITNSKHYTALARPNQAKFRTSLLEYYGSQCAITGKNSPRALEAAHIGPFSDKGVDNISNGLLLRADLHRLFDFDELAIDPASMKVVISKSAQAAYLSLGNAIVIKIPDGGPTSERFDRRWQSYINANP